MLKRELEIENEELVQALESIYDAALSGDVEAIKEITADALDLSEDSEEGEEDKEEDDAEDETDSE